MSDPYSQADVARYAELAYAAFNYGPDNRAGPSDTRNFSDEVLERYDISASVGWAVCPPSFTLLSRWWANCPPYGGIAGLLLSAGRG